MKISELIEQLEYQLKTYGDANVRIDWTRHKQTKPDDIFLCRIIGNYDIEHSPDKVNEPATDSDGLWIQNYPY